MKKIILLMSSMFLLFTFGVGLNGGFAKETGTSKSTTKKYTITYNASSGTDAPSKQTKEAGVDILLSSQIPTRKDHVFIEWNTAQKGTGISYQPGSLYTKDEKATLYAQWYKILKYTITYSANSGTGAPSKQIKEQGTDLILSSAVPKRNGYIFVGWNTAKDGSGVSYGPGSIYSVDQKATLYAQWREIVTVSYNANGGKDSPAKQIKENEIDLVLSGTVPTRKGYAFTGWNTAKNGSGTSYQPGDKYSINKKVILYAQWRKVVTYTISYNANGGKDAPAQQLKEKGINLTLSGTVPTKEIYTFTGWNTAKNGTGTSYQPGDVYTKDAKATLYAQWAIYVIWNRDAGIVSKDNPKEELNSQPYFEEEEDYCIPTFDVIYDANGGTGAPSDQTKSCYMPLTLSSVVPTKDGYDFVEWNTSKDGKGESYRAGGTYTENSSVTLYAKWRVAEEDVSIFDFYTEVIYDANGGQGAPTDQKRYASLTFSLSNVVPTRYGYKFMGWNTAKDGSGTLCQPGSTDAWGTVFYAQWEKDYKYIRYDANGGTGAPTSQRKEYGIDLKISTSEPKKTGYVFSGWNTSKDGKGKTYYPNETYSQNADLMLYAKWEHLHTGGRVTCTQDAVCTGCKAVYMKALKHNFSNEWKSDGTYHWNECTRLQCNEVRNKVKHSCDTEDICKNGARCVYCGYQYIKPGHDYSGGYEYEFRSIFEHVKKCKRCGEILESEGHYIGKLSDPACFEGTACIVCRYVFIDIRFHNYDVWGKCRYCGAYR